MNRHVACNFMQLLKKLLIFTMVVIVLQLLRSNFDPTDFKGRINIVASPNSTSSHLFQVVVNESHIIPSQIVYLPNVNISFLKNIS